MKKLLFVALFFPLIVSSQIHPESYLKGEWFSCADHPLLMDSVYSFGREKLKCEENQCQSWRWTFSANGKADRSFGGGCDGHILSGFYIIPTADWKYDAEKKDLSLREEKTDLVFRVLHLSKDSLVVKKIWQVKLH